MKQLLSVIGLAGLLVLVLTVRAWASPKVPPLQAPAGINALQTQSTPASSAQTGQNTGWGGRMGGGHMGRGMMTGGEDNRMATATMIEYMTPMHDDVAMQLGMSTEDLYYQMANGRSLTQVAAEQGITEQQLMDGIMAGRQSAYHQAVLVGHMAQTQADAFLHDLNNNLKRMLNDQGTESTGWGMMWGTESGEATMYRMHH